MSAGLVLPVHGQDDAGTFGKEHGDALIDLLGQPEDMLDNTANAATVVEQLLDAGRTVGAPETADGGVPGLMDIYGRREEDELTDQTEIGLSFADLKAANAFRAEIAAAYGMPDPACTNETRAHWLLAPGLSMSWRIDAYENPVYAIFTVLASDPLDGNCSRTVAPGNALVDVEDLTAFFMRLRQDPPPLGGAKSMALWLTPYGAIEVIDEDECAASLWGENPAALSGIGTITAELKFCAVTPNDRVSVLTLMSVLFADMYGLEHALEAAEAALGAKDARCSIEGVRSVWPLKDNRTLVITELYSAFGVLVVDTDLGASSDCGPGGA